MHCMDTTVQQSNYTAKYPRWITILHALQSPKTGKEYRYSIMVGPSYPAFLIIGHAKIFIIQTRKAISTINQILDGVLKRELLLIMHLRDHRDC